MSRLLTYYKLRLHRRLGQIRRPAEEHNVIGGLGGLICEIAADKCPKKICRIGIQDTYAESGDANKLMAKYKLDGEGVYEQVKAAL